MLYYFLIGLVFLAGLSAPLAAKDLANIETSFDQKEVLSLRLNQNSGCSCQKAIAPQKKSDGLGVHTTAKAAIVADQQSGAVLFQKEPEQQLPIASITKLMTALVFLENNPGFDQIGQIGSGENDLEGARLFVKDNERIKLKDLFYVSLVGSANNATQALVHSTGLTGEEFVIKMNQKAQKLGMSHTFFAEPTGLTEQNVSTASDLVKLAKAAFNNSEIKEATTLEEYSFITEGNKEFHKVVSQDELLKSYLDLTGTKTGFTYEAGYCLIVQSKNESGHEVIAAVLGSESSDARFQEVKSLVSWAFENYQWELE